jgi:hypothetical protein
MALGLRSVVGASLVLSTLTVPAVMACREDPMQTMVGAVGQACFPGDKCNPGLTCLPINYDGGFTDGGQCVCLDASDCFPDVEVEEADAPASANDATKSGD